jgi:hypothetical protein
MAEDDDSRLSFRYSRERRLKKATPAVRALNDPTLRPKAGLFRSLTANRGLAFLFIAIVLLSITALLTTFLGAYFNDADLAGNRISAEAFRFDGSVYLTIKKEATAADAYRGPVGVSYAAGGGGAALEGLLFTAAAAEEFRRILPVEAEGIELFFLADGKTARLELAVR